MIDAIDRQPEVELRRHVQPDRLQRHLSAFEGLERVSGTQDELIACEYILDQLEAYGVDATLHEFEGYVSVPESASLTVRTERESITIDEAIPASFATSTPEEGISGELILRSDDAEGPLDGHPIVLTEGLPSPERVMQLEAAGAGAGVFQSPTGDHLHEMIVTPVWGTPGIDDIDRVPELPVIQISQTEGKRLVGQLEDRRLKATVRTDVRTELTTLPCPVGHIEGQQSDRYLLVGNHVDSWYEGATDNATAVAATLELARIFADVGPRRGVVFGFWPAHSTGRYAGSTWFADTNWHDLRDNGVAYLHLDLNGLRGADELWYQHMAELADEHIDAMEVGCNFPIGDWQESLLGSKRPNRHSDQSFWGPGLSSLLSGARLQPGTEEGGPIGGGWWWHTSDDTMDKVDLEVLTEETKLFVTIASRICCSDVLPHDYRRTADEIVAVLDTLPGDNNRINHLREQAVKLRELFQSVVNIVHAASDLDRVLETAVEDLQVDLGNILIPALYIGGSKFEHDPAIPQQRLPYLRIQESVFESEDPTRRFAEVTMIRQSNRLLHGLHRASDRTERFLNRFE